MIIQSTIFKWSLEEGLEPAPLPPSCLPSSLSQSWVFGWINALIGGLSIQTHFLCSLHAVNVTYADSCQNQQGCPSHYAGAVLCISDTVGHKCNHKPQGQALHSIRGSPWNVNSRWSELPEGWDRKGLSSPLADPVMLGGLQAEQRTMKITVPGSAC